jgi:hypothetical protein
VAAAASTGVAAAATTALGSGAAGALAGSLLGIAGAVLGARASITNTRSPRERAFMVRMTWIAGALCLGLLALEAAAVLVLLRVASGGPLSPAAVTATVLGLGAVSAVIVLWLVVWGNRRQRQIQIEEGTYTPTTPSPHVDMSPGAIYGSFAGSLGGILWIFPMCWIAGDWLVAAVVLAVSGVAYLVSVRLTLTRPERYFRVAFWEGIALGALLLAVVNLRWEPWMAVYRDSRWYEPLADWPLWLVNVVIVALIFEGQRKLLKLGRQSRSG